MEQMKVEKVRLEEELRNIQNGQPQYDHTDIEAVQTKVAAKEKCLRDLRSNTQRGLFQIADLKSGLFNVAKQLGVRKVVDVEITSTASVNEFASKLTDRFNLIIKRIQVMQHK